MVHPRHGWSVVHHAAQSGSAKVLSELLEVHFLVS